jgi:hypothetical protein
MCHINGVVKDFDIAEKYGCNFMLLRRIEISTDKKMLLIENFITNDTK